jgi:hypothetical protein
VDILISTITVRCGVILVCIGGDDCVDLLVSNAGASMCLVDVVAVGVEELLIVSGFHALTAGTIDHTHCIQLSLRSLPDTESFVR